MTKLAYNINQQFYGNLHYLWCTPYFESDYSAPTFAVPPSSSPLEIYNRLKREVESGDGHDSLIKVKRLGARRGADAMEKRGKITAAQAKEIRTICKLADREQFKPLMCIIPRLEAIPYSQTVDVKSKAHPLSQEYVVADLPHTAFDVIRIG
ncbi:hypothetical protein [Bradyrhizobium sp. 930_D9_N1_4]|uniref:hypothetical protein n=1 Tax=Bradyrhizobium sp. 930_D9_N1_4 TaxID=3240374 RepID=UPI003F8B4243